MVNINGKYSKCYLEMMGKKGALWQVRLAGVFLLLYYFVLLQIFLKSLLLI